MENRENGPTQEQTPKRVEGFKQSIRFGIFIPEDFFETFELFQRLLIKDPILNSMKLANDKNRRSIKIRQLIAGYVQANKGSLM